MGWKCRDLTLLVDARVQVMGILNVTPDSFSDGGRFLDPPAAVAQAERMLADGADIIDIGGESTRPGAAEVCERDEIRRVIPVVEAVAATGAVLSIDTTKAAVARAACAAGARIINDVSAFRADEAMAGVAAETGAGIILMHMLGTPRTMQSNPVYGDVVGEVAGALAGWARMAEAVGVDPAAIAIDPGIGFGKTLEHNLELLRATDRLCAAGYPVVIGPSRKSFIGAVLGLPVDQRLEGTAAVVAYTVLKGARIVRVHDVKEMSRLVRMLASLTAGEVSA